MNDPATFARHLFNVSLVAAVLSIPQVTRATGISALTVISIVAVHILWTYAVWFVIRPSASSPVRFHVALAGSVVINTSICVAFAVLGTDPRTPLWMLPVMYACFNGASQEQEPSVGVLMIHVVTPLLAIPLLLARGKDPGWSIAAPLLCSAISAVGYNYLAQMSAGWREHRRQNDMALAMLREKLDTDDRARLARELHDGLGSSLAFVGLYGDLIEQHAERPDELRVIAAMVRDAAREGDADLRALIRAVTPDGITVDLLAAAFVELGLRASGPTGATIDVSVHRGGTLELEGTLRLALVRVFQESLNNALRHGAAKRVRVDIAAGSLEVEIKITDDGIGFDPAHVEAGHGLSGMRARATELGGSFTLTTAPRAGTEIRVTFPRVEPAAA